MPNRPCANFALAKGMVRKLIPESSINILHITARTVNRELFPLPLAQIWPIFEDYLYFANKAHNMRIYSFVLMPNHIHLIARFPDKNIRETMCYFMGETSRRISELSCRKNQIYGGRYHRSVITTDRYFRHAYKYVYRNPVKASLCNKVEEYPFSTLYGLVGNGTLSIPVEEDTLLFYDGINFAAIDWLNKKPADIHQDEIRRALRRQIFELPRNKNTTKSSDLETADF